MDPFFQLLTRLDQQAMRGVARSAASRDDRAACTTCLATGILQHGDCNMACLVCKGTGATSSQPDEVVPLGGHHGRYGREAE